MVTESANKQAHSCMRVILKGVVRVALRCSIKLTDLVELLKIVLVEVATEELEKKGETISGSKVSAMTGVHRKDVTRINLESGKFEPPSNLISRIMTQWQTDSEFTTKAGKPRVLNAEGRHSEFAELVDTVNGGNISSYSILFEMERMGILQKTGSKVKLLWQDFVVREDVEQGLSYLAEDARDLLSSVEENIFERQEAANLHLKTEFERIDDSAVPEIRTWLLEEGSRFQKKVREYLSKFDADIQKNIKASEANTRVALGTFSFMDRGSNEGQR